MKTHYKYTIRMAALAIVGAAITACSSTDDEQAAQPAGKSIVLKGTLADKDGGNATRALTVDGAGAITASWAEGEKVAIYYETEKTETGRATDTATIINADGLFEAAIDEKKAPKDGGTVKFIYPASRHDGEGGYSTEGIGQQTGTIDGAKGISEDWDILTGEGTMTVEGRTATMGSGSVPMKTQLSIFRFELKDSEEQPVAATALTIKVGETTYTVSPAEATDVVYVAMPACSDQTVNFIANAGSYYYAYEKSGVSFDSRQYYMYTVKMTKLVTSYTDPTLKTGLTYTSSPLALVNAGSAEHGTIYYSTDGGNTWSTSVPTATDAGTYTVHYKVEPDEYYNDGVEPTSLGDATIAKAACTVSLTPTSLALNDNTPTGTITVTRSGDGVVSATSSNTDVATVSVEGTTVTVTAVAPGTATVTVTVAEGTNHTAYTTTDKTVSVMSGDNNATLQDYNKKPYTEE